MLVLPLQIWLSMWEKRNPRCLSFSIFIKLTQYQMQALSVPTKHPGADVIVVALAANKGEQDGKNSASISSLHERVPKKYRWSASNALVTTTFSH